MPLLIGTDRGAGWLIQRDLELYIEAGIPAPDVMHHATLGVARRLGVDRDLGSLAPGKLADFIIVDGDPFARMRDIRRVVLTVNPADIRRLRE